MAAAPDDAALNSPDLNGPDLNGPGQDRRPGQDGLAGQDGGRTDEEEKKTGVLRKMRKAVRPPAEKSLAAVKANKRRTSGLTIGAILVIAAIAAFAPSLLPWAMLGGGAALLYKSSQGWKKGDALKSAQTRQGGPDSSLKSTPAAGAGPSQEASNQQTPAAADDLSHAIARIADGIDRALSGQSQPVATGPQVETAESPSRPGTSLSEDWPGRNSPTPAFQEGAEPQHGVMEYYAPQPQNPSVLRGEVRQWPLQNNGDVGQSRPGSTYGDVGDTSQSQLRRTYSDVSVMSQLQPPSPLVPNAQAYAPDRTSSPTGSSSSNAATTRPSGQGTSTPKQGKGR
jgi:hypothetical protein